MVYSFWNNLIFEEGGGEGNNHATRGEDGGGGGGNDLASRGDGGGGKGGAAGRQCGGEREERAAPTSSKLKTRSRVRSANKRGG